MELKEYENLLTIARLAPLDNPKRMVFGIEAVTKVGEEAKRLKTKNILVVTDENIEKAGLLDKVKAPLDAEKLKYYVYKIPTAEPTMSSAKAITDHVRKNKYDLVIGVGGGSCMDSAKLAAIMATNKGDVESYCASATRAPEPLTEDALPKILIPTTAGTGSEASNTLVIIDGGYKTWITDAKVLADVAIVDPLMTLTCPPRMTAGSGMDALSHLAEAVMVRKWHPISDAIALKGISLVAQNLRKAYYDGNNLEARWGMSLAAMLGGWVIGFPWVGGPATIGHCIAEALGPKWNVPHGVSCAICLPYAMKYNLPATPERIRLIGEAMGVETEGLNDYEAAEEAVRAVAELACDVNISLALKDYKVPKDELKSFAEYLVNERQYMYDLKNNNPRAITLESITALMEQMWEGEL